MNYTNEQKKIFQQAMTVLHNARRTLKETENITLIAQNARCDVEKAISLFEKIEP